MTTYESDIKTISSDEEMVFTILNDLNNLSKLSENGELKEKLRDLQFDTDSCSFSVEGFGRLGFRIVEREPFKTIKLMSENAPVNVTGWIHLNQVDEKNTQLKLMLQADLPMMIKMMVDKKIKEGINTVADMLAIALTPNLRQ